MATYKNFRELANALGVDPDHPTVADQQKVKDWIAANPEYEAGDVTNSYLNAKPGLFNYNPSEQPPADTPEVDTSKLQVQTPSPLTPDFSEQPLQPEEQAKQPSIANRLANRLADISLSPAMLAWTPAAASLATGGDASGEAAGYRAQAAQNAQNAAQNQKIMQWNQQRATDNRLADKIAASQAAKQYKQVAQSVGIEGGAGAAAAATQTVAPDYMAEKNYQTQQMDKATQNLAEVNRNKLMQIGNETNESMTNYDTQVQEAQNAYKQNLAEAKDSQKKDTTEDTVEKPKEKTTTEEAKPDSNVQEDTDKHGDKAPSNQESNVVTDTTNQVAQNQTADSIKDDAQTVVNKINEKLKAHVNDQELLDLRDQLAALRSKYDELGGDTAAFPTPWKPSDDTTNVGSLASTLSDLKI